MLRFRSAPLAEDFVCSTVSVKPRMSVEIPASSLQTRPFVRRRLSPEGGRALEVLGHAIEYLADEYAADVAHKGPLGNADPRVEAIQILKALNRSVYYAGTPSQPVLGRMRRWLADYMSSGS